MSLLHQGYVANQGLDPAPSTPAAFAAFRKAEESKWARVIKEANIRAP